MLACRTCWPSSISAPSRCGRRSCRGLRTTVATSVRPQLPDFSQCPVVCADLGSPRMLLRLPRPALPSIKERKAAFDAYCKKAVHTYRPTKLQVRLQTPFGRRSQTLTPHPVLAMAMAVAAGILGRQGSVRIAAARRGAGWTPDAAQHAGGVHPPVRQGPPLPCAGRARARCRRQGGH